MRILAALLAAFVMVGFSMPSAMAKKIPHPDIPKVVFVPHDNRPISDEQTADTMKAIGWNVETPPEEILGSRDNLGNPDDVWDWLEETAADANIAVLSSDTLLYGSLVGSRKHDYPQRVIDSRIERFREFKALHPDLKIYVFGSIMRTPRSAEASGGVEPSYYESYGSDIFRYTALTDKMEIEGLTKREKKEFEFLGKLIPKDAIDDWLSRRNKNFSANKKLIQLEREGLFSYLALGRDDNAPYSQTHMESRKLAAEGADLGPSKFQAMAGIDEVAMLMLIRAVNDWTSSVPFVYVRYNWGRGGNTVPKYSDEKISDSMKAHVVAAGGLMVNSPKNADFVLLVNTNPNGQTYEANDRANDGKPREGTKYFADLVQESVESGKPTCVADVSYANGADNALMEMLKGRDLLFKLRAYSGWNTPTNSTGFVLSQGMLASKMTDEACDRLLMTRYLDDWAYQANIRGIVARQLGWLRASGTYSALGDRKRAAEARTTNFMRRFVEENLPPMEGLQYLEVTFPWNRMFEAKFDLSKPFDFKEYKAAHMAE
ncbi:MAG: DUF4127 family protein [Schwartzia sp.]|nr:DUF4127 family protein [Schwartzia sp. (in: firmicutes)]